jgi:SAM-dependent methyltransferase
MKSRRKVFYKNTKSRPPNKLLVKYLPEINSNGLNALDLGSGAGRDTKYLLENDFTVTAVDRNRDSEKFLEPLPRQENLNFVCTSFESFEYAKYDLINASYSLPFINPNDFNSTFKKIINSMNPGAIFIGQLFGEDDEWNVRNSNLTFMSIEDVKKLLNNLEILQINETNDLGPTGEGKTKHWHVYDIVFRKPLN